MALSLPRTKNEDLARARDPRTSRAELVDLAAHGKADVRAAIAARLDCPLATMLSLAYESDPRVLEALATNPSAPRSVLEVLASHKRESIGLLAQRRLRTARMYA